jgi:hypothetical protein
MPDCQALFFKGKRQKADQTLGKCLVRVCFLILINRRNSRAALAID